MADEPRTEQTAQSTDAESSSSRTSSNERRDDRQDDRRRDSRRPYRRGQRRRRKVCRFCTEKMQTIDYKDIGLLQEYVSHHGRILARRKTGTCAKHQRLVTRAIKRARHVALLPYAAQHVNQ